MSLDWNTTRCDPPLPKDDDDRDLRHTLIWGAMAVDLQKITDKNIEEWVFRLKFQEAIGLDYISLGDMSSDLESLRAGLRRWVGLGTNVATLTRPQWLKKVTALVAGRVMRDIQPVEVET